MREVVEKHKRTRQPNCRSVAEIIDKKMKIAEMEKRISELTDKSLAIAKMGYQLNALFDVLKQTADSGVGKKI